MDDPAWLLEELERWQVPAAEDPEAAAFHVAADSHEHQHLASRLQQAITSSRAVPAGGTLPPPF